MGRIPTDIHPLEWRKNMSILIQMELPEHLNNPQKTMGISRFFIFVFRFLIASTNRAFFVTIGMYRAFLVKLKPQTPKS